jgi:glycosyltransferase involved in cell wall biosynthesis
MKILIATGIYPPAIGGPATYSKLLHDELPARGFDVSVCNFGDVLRFPKVFRHFMYFWRLVGAAKDVDVIYAQDPVSVGFPALLASQVRGKRFIVKIVGDYAWEQSTQRFGVTDRLDDFSKTSARYSFRVKFLKKIQKYVADGAERIVTPSKYLKGIISNWGVDPKKIVVIYNGFDFKGVSSPKSVLRHKLTLTGTIIVSAGRLVPWKGFSALIDAFAEVKKEIPDAILFIAGEGPLKGELEEKAVENKITESVTFLGKVSQASLFEYVKAADVFVLNTDYEGFSHQLLETMALGTPIITTPVGGNVEVIDDGHTGIFVGYNDKMKIVESVLRIVRNPVSSEAMVKNAKVKVKEFSDERMLESLAAFLKTIQ